MTKAEANYIAPVVSARRSSSWRVPFKPPTTADSLPFELAHEQILGHRVTFRKSDGYGNLTELCAAYRKQPAQFLRLPSTKRFVAALARQENKLCENLIVTKDGSSGGT